MITGGSPSHVGKRVELLFPNGTHMCELESFPDTRMDHSQNGLITCGGYDTFDDITCRDSCLIFSDGAWKRHGTTLMHGRMNHLSWTRGNATMLIGGSISGNTTETISMEGVHQETFDLIYPIGLGYQ